MAVERRLRQAEAAVEQHLRASGEAQRGGVGRIAFFATAVQPERHEKEIQHRREAKQAAPREGVEKFVVQMAEGGEVGGRAPAVLVHI